MNNYREQDDGGSWFLHFLLFSVLIWVLIAIGVKWMLS